MNDRATYDKLAANIFDFLWTAVKASIHGIIARSPSSVLGESYGSISMGTLPTISKGRTLQHTQSFRVEQQQPAREVQHQTPSTPHQYSEHSSEMPIQVSPIISSPSLPLQSHLDHIALNQLNGSNRHLEQTSTDNVGMVDVHDMIQPILRVQPHVCEPPSDPSQGNVAEMVNVHEMPQHVLPQVFGSLGEQSRIDVANMLDVHDMIQPILPTQEFYPLEDSSTVDIHDMLQPILPMRDCEPFKEKSQKRTSNMVRFHELGQPIFPTETASLSDTQLPNMFQSSPIERQVSIIQDPLNMPMATHSQDITTHNNLFLQPVSAA